MVILGIDPGSRITGFGVIKIQDKKMYYVASGCIRITDEDTANRLKQIQDGINEVISIYCPTESAIEQIFERLGLGRSCQSIFSYSTSNFQMSFIFHSFFVR